MTASWLKQMGWQEVYVLAEAGTEKGQPPRKLLGTPAADAGIEPAELSALLTKDAATVVDLSTSLRYRRGHIPGAWFAIRFRLARALPKIPLRGELVLTCEDGMLSGLAVEEARALTKGSVRALKGGNAAWTAAKLPFETEVRMADEPVDLWLKPYEQLNDNEAAMNAYLSWEVDLLDRIKQDGTTHFLHAR